MPGASASAGVTPYLILGTYPGAILFWISFDPAIENCLLNGCHLPWKLESVTFHKPAAWSPKAPVTFSQGA